MPREPMQFCGLGLFGSTKLVTMTLSPPPRATNYTSFRSPIAIGYAVLKLARVRVHRQLEFIGEMGGCWPMLGLRVRVLVSPPGLMFCLCFIFMLTILSDQSLSQYLPDLSSVVVTFDSGPTFINRSHRETIMCRESGIRLSLG